MKRLSELKTIATKVFEAFGGSERLRCPDAKRLSLLSEGATHVDNSSARRKVAFTLAEVLITLGIIGVVAAMTMPTLIQNHQKQSYVAGLKKSVSIAQNMLKKIQADEEVSSIGMTKLFLEGVCEHKFVPATDEYGNIDYNKGYVNGNGCEDTYGNPSLFESIVPKYLKVVKMCHGEECGDIYNITNFNCNNNNCSLSNSYKGNICSVSAVEDEGCGNIYGFYTADGMLLYMYPSPKRDVTSSATIEFIVDVNGKKGPNTLNRDVFTYGIMPEGKLRPELGWRKEGLVYLMQNGWKMDY